MEVAQPVLYGGGVGDDAPAPVEGQHARYIVCDRFGGHPGAECGCLEAGADVRGYPFQEGDLRATKVGVATFSYQVSLSPEAPIDEDATYFVTEP
jgi:hypothetical protein